MSVAISLLIACVSLFLSGVSTGKVPTIKDCKQQKSGDIDCRNMGFLNVPYDAFSVPRVKIYLSGNPYLCDCSMVWFLREEEKNRKRVVDLSSMKCAYPDKLNTFSLAKLKHKDICHHKLYKIQDYCWAWSRTWDCQNPPPRIPIDAFTIWGGGIMLYGDFICDCDMVWVLRRWRTLEVRKRFVHWDHGMFCKLPANLKGKVKPKLIYKHTEQEICPQKEPNQCMVRPNPCPAKVTKCVKTKNSHECVDVNECLKRPCKSFEVCVNKKKTGYECQCPKELVRDKKTKKCVVPDPCDDKNTCPSTAKCESIRKKSGMSHRCVDIDECLTGKNTCGVEEECYNKENGYECRCKPGLTRVEGGCIANVNPCKANPPVCDPKTQRCVAGEKPNSFECEDIDECATNQHDCHKDAKCINNVTGYECKCKAGFKGYDNGRQCKDLNECIDKFRCAKHAKCINTVGSFKCICNAGYSGDGKYCKEKDECKGHGRCSVDAVCKNKPGSYECVCKNGYQGNGKICKDVNECSQNKHSCPKHSRCRNTPGSYTCKCKHGYKLHNSRCVDVDECKIKSHKCDKNALCVNFAGSYKCRCKEGYEHLKDGRLCLKEVDSEDKSKFVILIAAPACALVVLLLCCCICCARRRKRRQQSSGREENKSLLGKSVSSDSQQQVFMFDPKAQQDYSDDERG